MIVKGWLVSTMSLSSCPFLLFSCILPAKAYGSSSDNNTYVSFTVNCQKKCSYRSCLALGRLKMLRMTKQRKRENGETMSVVKAQQTIYPYVNFAEGTVLIRVNHKSDHDMRSSALAPFAVTANHLFSKYRLQALVLKILASQSHRPPLN